MNTYLKSAENSLFCILRPEAEDNIRSSISRRKVEHWEKSPSRTRRNHSWNVMVVPIFRSDCNSGEGSLSVHPL
jgi:hypothetical protein